MHYGWPVDMGFLFSYAEQHGLLRYYQRLVLDDDRDEDSDHEKETKVINTLNRYGSSSQAFRHIVELVGGWSMLRHVVLVTVRQRQNPMLVSLFTNYTLMNAPTDEFKRALCEKLQLTGEPRWYLDREDARWQTEVPDRVFIGDSDLCLMEEVEEEDE